MTKEFSSHVETLSQHAGSEYRVGRGLVGAVEKAVTFSTPTLEEAPVYSRLGNTNNHKELEAMLAALHGAEGAIALGSGMSAWTLLFMTLAKPGDHVLCPDVCYGGTYNFFTKVMSKWGVTTTFAPLKEWPKHLNSKTRFVICETISNPFCVPQDIAWAATFAKSNQLISVCDNTFASPVLCKPLDLGFDFVMESATKYLNGHADVIAGMLAGSAANIEKLRSAHAYLGTFLPPDQCAQLLRGIRTLGLRVMKQQENAVSVTSSIRTNPLVKKVYYGSTEKLTGFDSGYGAMMGVEFKESVNMQTFMQRLRLIKDVPSLGSTETTATIPAFTTNWFMSEEEKKSIGISNHLVRFSIGLENPKDLVADIEQALKA